MQKFNPNDTITFKASRDDREVLTGIVVSQPGPGTLKVWMSDGQTVGLAIDSTVQRVEVVENAPELTQDGADGAKSGKTIKDTSGPEMGRKIEAQAATPMPERIYLQWHGDGEAQDGAIDDADVTWCRDRIHKNDVLYVRADLVTMREGTP